MYKKILALLMAISLTFAMTACGGGGKSGDPSGGSSGSAIKFAFWDSNQAVGLEAMAKAYMDANPGTDIKVEITPWEEYWTKLQAAAQGSSLPDVFVMHPDKVDLYVEGDILMDLTEITTSKVDMSKFPQYVNEDFNVGGKQYAIPKDIGTLALAYNKDLFDAAGVEYPNSNWTWEDLEEAAKAITNPANDIYGMAAPNDGQSLYWNLIWQNKGEVMQDGVCVMDSPEAIEAVEFAVSFIENGYSPTVEDFATLTDEEYFQSGKIAMTFTGSWMLNQYLMMDGFNFDIAELPMGKQRAAICSGMGYSVSKNSKSADLAMDFVAYLGTAEAQQIQAETGIAIPAYEGTQQPWIDGFKTIDASAFVKVTDYGRTSPRITATNEATLILDEVMPQVFALQMSVEEGLKEITKRINELNGVS